MNAQSLDEQRMRRQEDQDYQAQYNGDQGRYSRAAAPSDPESAAVVPPTVLIFRDQRKQEIRNYAIVGQTLWNFASQRTEKIPLSDLDLPATDESQRRPRLDIPRPDAGEAQ